MFNNIIEFLQKFNEVKSLGSVKSMRKGSTGVGYTFECLIDKKEDQECNADFKGIEIKCSTGNGKYPIKLFCLESERENNEESAKYYIFSKYGYYDKNEYVKSKKFYRIVYKGRKYEHDGVSFDIHVDYESQKVILQSFTNGIYTEDVSYWSFERIERVLKNKLQILALVDAVKYDINFEKYYSYYMVTIYELISEFKFLELLEKGRISIEISLKEGLNKLGDVILENHGTSFRIYRDDIEELFYKINTNKMYNLKKQLDS